MTLIRETIIIMSTITKTIKIIAVKVTIIPISNNMKLITILSMKKTLLNLTPQIYS